MTACEHFRSWSSGRKEAGLGGTWSKQNSSSKNSMRAEPRSWVLAFDKADHLLFIPHRYLVGILCEENETNTREPAYQFKLQALFFFFNSPPMSFWLPLELSVHACEFYGAVSGSHKQHPNFSHLFFTPDVMFLSRVSCLWKNWKRFRICFGRLPCTWHRPQRAKGSLLIVMWRASNRVFPWWTCR